MITWQAKKKKRSVFYPLLTDDTCYFLAVDFDEADWEKLM